MSFKPIKYQIVVFGEYQDIIPEPTIIQKLFNDLIKFNLVPGTTTNEFDISKGQMVTSLKFSTIDNQIVLGFKSNHIQIEMFDISSKPISTLNNFLEIATGIITEVQKNFFRLSNRLSLLTNFVDENLSNTNKDNFYKRVFNILAENSPELPYEWSHRAVSRYKRTFNKNSEMFNNIVTINRGFTVFSPNITFVVNKGNRIELTFDINTIPENRVARFEKNDVSVFYKDVIDWHNTMFQQTTQAINYNGEND